MIKLPCNTFKGDYLEIGKPETNNDNGIYTMRFAGFVSQKISANILSIESLIELQKHLNYYIPIMKQKKMEYLLTGGETDAK